MGNRKKSPDQADKNLSSIMFDFKDALDGTILLTGDSVGWILDQNFQSTTPDPWTIMKVGAAFPSLCY